LKKQSPIQRDAITETVRPTDPLAAERLIVFRGFRPADRIGSECDSVRDTPLGHDPVQAHGKFHVLSDHVRVITADADDDLFVKEAEGAGNQQESVQR